MTRIKITGGDSLGSRRTRAATHYGVRELDKNAPACHQQALGIEVLEFMLNYDELPTTATLDKLFQAVPANARIKDCTLQVVEAFVGGTSYAIGLVEEDGTAIDPDGLFTDVDLALANIGAVGDVVEGTGALVGESIGAAAGQILVTESGTFTAGKAIVRIRLVPAYIRDDEKV